MRRAPIRTAQLVSPFGPGSLYTNTDGHVLLVAGLDQWFARRDGGELKHLEPDDIAEFVIDEPRLSRLLGGVRFRRAPDYRRPVRNGGVAPNMDLTVPAVRFPTWYRKQSGEGGGSLKQVNYFQEGAVRELEAGVPMGRGGRNPARRGGNAGTWNGRWTPVRFATACESGHLNEFPWKVWAGCTCNDDNGLRLEDDGGTGLDSIRIRCVTCPEGSPGRTGRSLQGLTYLPDDENEPSELGKAQILCSGNRPWLGNDHEACDSKHNKRLVAVLLNQSNLYQAQTASSLKLPDAADVQGETEKILEFTRAAEQWRLRERVTQRWQLGQQDQAIGNIEDALADSGKFSEGVSRSSITSALKTLCGERVDTRNGPAPQQPESDSVSFRREEFNLLRTGTPRDTQNSVLQIVDTDVPKSLAGHIAQVARVEKLTEVRALCGFSRLSEQTIPLSGVAAGARSQLYRTPPARPEDLWVPAMQVHGEGIFICLSEGAFVQWYAKNERWLARRLERHMVERMASLHRLMPPLSNPDNQWAARFMLIHTFSHLLINQLVFESGYSSAALRERLYVSPDVAAPMIAVLIYTAQGDSEGTLGGLVNLGHPDRFEPIVMRALGKASWCSADPVCSESRAHGASNVNLAACHACSLLPETACETLNDGLDRGVVVGTVEQRCVGFFSDVQ